MTEEDQYVVAHKRSFRNRETVESSKQCGCFCCQSVFDAADVEEYVRVDETAICPRCGVDSVLGDQAGFPLTEEFLSGMERRWFGDDQESTV